MMTFLEKPPFLLIGLFLIIFLIRCNPPVQSAEIDMASHENIRRFGQIIKVKPDKLEYYKELHANPWPCVLDKIHECNIRNYSIYLQDSLLFAHFEYIGSDFDADMKKIAEDSCTQKWWSETDPCQEPISSAPEGTWWTTMEEVFHTD